MGVLQMILTSIRLIPSLTSDQDLVSIIKNSCDFMLDQQFPSGNFPSSVGSKDDIKLHFCHGLTGSIPFLISASNVFKDERYLQAAIKAGEDLWVRGILLKGNGICHGISGNSYALHSLFRATGNELWLKRAYRFALATFDPEIQNICKEYDDPQRIEIGLPDTPFSLMEGSGGELSLLADLLKEDLQCVRFPGYEIL